MDTILSHFRGILEYFKKSEIHNLRMFNFLRRKILSKVHNLVQDFILGEIKQNYEEFEREKLSELLKSTKLNNLNVEEALKNESRYKVVFEYIMKHKIFDSNNNHSYSAYCVYLYLKEVANYSPYLKIIEECVIYLNYKYRINRIRSLLKTLKLMIRNVKRRKRDGIFLMNLMIQF